MEVQRLLYKTVAFRVCLLRVYVRDTLALHTHRASDVAPLIFRFMNSVLEPLFCRLIFVSDARRTFAALLPEQAQCFIQPRRLRPCRFLLGVVVEGITVRQVNSLVYPELRCTFA